MGGEGEGVGVDLVGRVGSGVEGIRFSRGKGAVWGCGG